MAEALWSFSLGEQAAGQTDVGALTVAWFNVNGDGGFRKFIPDIFL